MVRKLEISYKFIDSLKNIVKMVGILTLHLLNYSISYSYLLKPEIAVKLLLEVEDNYLSYNVFVCHGNLLVVIDFFFTENSKF